MWSTSRRHSKPQLISDHLESGGFGDLPRSPLAAGDRSLPVIGETPSKGLFGSGRSLRQMAGSLFRMAVVGRPAPTVAYLFKLHMGNTILLFTLIYLTMYTAGWTVFFTICYPANMHLVLVWTWSSWETNHRFRRSMTIVGVVIVAALTYLPVCPLAPYLPVPALLLAVPAALCFLGIAAGGLSGGLRAIGYLVFVAVTAIVSFVFGVIPCGFIVEFTYYILAPLFLGPRYNYFAPRSKYEAVPYGAARNKAFKAD
eukprot:g1636.t1